MAELLLSSSVLIAAMALLRLLLKNRVSARLIYALWLVAALRLMLPIQLAPSPVSVMNVPEQLYAQASSEAFRPAETGPVLTEPDTALEPPALTASPHSPVTAPETVPEEPAPPVTDYVGPRLGADALLKLVWLAGGCALAAALIVLNGAMYFRLRGSRRRLELPGASRRVYLADNLPSPCVFGIISPAIYLTPAALETPERAEMVLLHEQTHIRHGDHIWALLRCALLCVYWFDPFVWLAAYLSRRDAELACDESCVRRLGVEKRFDYGGAIVDLLDRQRRRASLLQAATTMSGGRGAVRERVKRIALAPKTRAAAVVLILALVAAVSACTFTGAEDSPEPPAGEYLANASAYTRMPDGSVFQANETHRYVWADGVLTLYSDSGEPVTLELEADREPAVFLSDSVAAVAYSNGFDTELLVSRDRGGSWTDSVGVNPLEWETGYTDFDCFIGFSTSENGWFVLSRATSDINANYAALVWFTEDGGENWVPAPQDIPLEYPLSGIAFTPDGFCMAAENAADGSAKLEVFSAPGWTGVEVYATGYEVENPENPDEDYSDCAVMAPRVTEEGFDYYLMPPGDDNLRPELLRQSYTAPDDNSGFWRIPDSSESPEESTGLAPGLYVVPIRDINGEFAHRFWNRQFGPPARGGTEVNIWAALYTTEESFELEVRSVFEDGSRVLPGESYGEYALDPDTLLLMPVVSLEPGDNGIGILFGAAADGAVGTCFSSPEAGQLDLTPISDPEDTGHGVYLRGATEDFLARQEAYDVFGGYPEDEPGVIYCALCASETVYDLEVFSLVLGEEYGTQPSRGETLYSQAELNPGRPLLVGNVSVGDVTPARGFSFRTEDGVMYEYYIDLAYATMIDGSFRPYALGTAAAGTGFGVYASAATAGVMSRFDEYDEADISGGAENTREVVLYSDTSIGALRVFALDWSSGYIEPSEGKTVFEKGGLWPARPLVLTVPNESMTPLFGFAFEDGDGTERGYYAYADGSGALHLSPLWSGQDVSDFEPFDTGLGLTANYAATELFEQYERWVIDRGFPDAEENVIMAALRTDVPLANFRYFALDYPEGGITPAEGRLISDFNGVFNPDQIFVVGFTQPGLTSTRGIAFTDANGIEHRFALAISGEDGSIILEEF